MNKRIKELAEQAEQYALGKANESNDEDYDYTFDDDFQRSSKSSSWDDSSSKSSSSSWPSSSDSSSSSSWSSSDSSSNSSDW
jgi:hypothetical protein